jgi:pimeloyl-ACP methyl ester carboxylesterase
MSHDLPNIGSVATATIDGLEIRYARSGAESGVPILLTSPWPESIYAFRGVLPRIAHLGPVLAVDLPGFGRSQSRPEIVAPQAMGHFIVQLARHFSLGRMHAVGPDVGTLALLFAALQKPDLFESIVGGGGVTEVDLAGKALKDLILSPPGAFANVDGGDIATQFARTTAAVTTPAAVLEDYRLSSAGSRFEEAAAFVRAYPTELPRLEALIPTIETPVLVIAGRNDAEVPPPNGQLLADNLPHCRHELLDAGHLAWEDQAEAYADALAAWIGGEYRSVDSG